MTGMTNLTDLLASMTPTLQSGIFVFATIPADSRHARASETCDDVSRGRRHDPDS